MNVSLTKELEAYVSDQVATGHYKSASEVIREALRNQIRRNTEQHLDNRIESALKQVQEGKVIDADEGYFQRKRDMIRQLYLNESQTS